MINCLHDLGESNLGVSKNRGVMDGENNGKPLLKWMIWGAFPLFLEIPTCNFNLGYTSLATNKTSRESFGIVFSVTPVKQGG